MIVGGCGITLEELTAAYSSFPCRGVYYPPSYVKQPKPQPAIGRQVFSHSTAFMVTDILSGLDRPDLPNNFESSLNLPKVAFKTGTSYGRRDAWAVGYSSEYTVGVWVGNVNMSGCPDLKGSKSAAPLMVDIFNTISTRHEKSILPQPHDLLTREVCATSGLLPTSRCNHLIEDYYSVRQSLNRFCEFDKEYLVSSDRKVSYCPSCIGNHQYKIVGMVTYPSELLNFWDQIHRPYTMAPPHNPECTRLFSGDGPKIISPSQDMTYFLVSDKQKIALEASSALDIDEHIWYVDDRYLGRKKSHEKVFLSLPGGDHTITCMDDKGRLSSVKIKIKYAL